VHQEIIIYSMYTALIVIPAAISMLSLIINQTSDGSVVVEISSVLERAII
jgi:hypothetical protein